MHRCNRKGRHVSIHAPAKERHHIFESRQGFKKFQSTLPRRSDSLFFLLYLVVKVSIHAPAKERHPATVTKVADNMFQSTLPRRSDDCPCYQVHGHPWFQSTLPRRSDSIYHQFSFSNIQYSLTFCTNRTFQNLQISFDKCPFNTFCYFFRCESPDIFMYTVDSHRTRTT